MRITLLLVAGVLVPAPAAGQSRVVDLARPDATIETTFSQLAAARELKDGRVVLVDVKEKLIQIADFAKNTVQTIGRNGSGPGEYNYPAGLVSMPGEQIWIYDPLNQRFLVVTGDGKVGELVTFSSLGGVKGVAMMLLPAADAKGRLYFEAVSQASLAVKDSTAILRWTRGRTGLDTAGYTAPMDFGIESKGGKVRLKAMRMFVPQETWVVDPAGRLARITPSPYRVIWYNGGGKTTVGPTIAYEPVAVTEEEKDEVLKSIKQAIAGAGGARAKIKIPEPEFARTKPPFPAKGAAVIGPGAEIWVTRSVLLKERSRYDRFDGKGRLIGQVTLAPRSGILGFGRNAIYVARKDEDDLMHLERYRWPVK